MKVFNDSSVVLEPENLRVVREPVRRGLTVLIEPVTVVEDRAVIERNL